MFFSHYLRPVAYHRQFEDRLLLKDEAGSWYLWNGETEALTEIEAGLARWLYQRPEVFPVSGPAMWFDTSSLPVVRDRGLLRFE